MNKFDKYEKRVYLSLMVFMLCCFLFMSYLSWSVQLDVVDSLEYAKDVYNDGLSEIEDIPFPLNETEDLRVRFSFLSHLGLIIFITAINSVVFAGSAVLALLYGIYIIIYYFEKTPGQRIDKLQKRFNKLERRLERERCV